MQLLQAWKDSLQVFLPKTFRSFLHTAIRSIIHVYIFLVRYCWWILIGVIGIEVLHAYMIHHNTPLSSYVVIIDVAYILTWDFLMYVMLLAFKPSLHVKDYRYIKKHVGRFMYVIPWFVVHKIALFATVSGFLVHMWHKSILLSALFRIKIYLVHTVSLFTGKFVSYTSGFIVGAVFDSFPFFVFFTLFLLDSDGSIRGFGLSLWNAVKMFIYNLPFCMSILVCFYIVRELAVMEMFTLFPAWDIQEFIANIKGFLLPIPISFFAVFYVKKLREQSQLYSLTSK